MDKTFELTIRITDKTSPQNWTFSKDVTSLEQIAIWTIVRELAAKKINEMTGEN